MRIYTVAFESSGRNWVDSLLRQHPDMEVLGCSFPANYMPERFYPTLTEDVDAVVIVVRDANCQEESVRIRGYNNGADGNFTPVENYEAIIQQIQSAKEKGVPVWFFSYETALRYRQFYLDWFFDKLGLHPVEINTDWKDGNLKYFEKGIAK